MITSVHIKNYKGFKRLEIPDISRITLLGGHNNIGKTSILEVLFMFYSRMNPNLILNQFNFRGIDEVIVSPDMMWAPIFYNYNMENELNISVKDNNAIEKMVVRFNPNYSYKPVSHPEQPIGGLKIKTNQESISAVSLDISYICENKNKNTQKTHLTISGQGLGMHVDYLEGNFKPASFIMARTRVSSNDDAFRYGQLDIEGKADNIVDFLRIIEPRLTSISTIANGNSTMIYGDIGIGRKIPLSLMGDGTSRLLSIILSIATSKNGIVLIDEIENGIHYSVMPKIWRAIGAATIEYNCQVIATTHSYECLRSALDGMSGMLEEEFRYIRLEKEKNKENEIVAKSFNYPMLKAAIERNWEVR